jgi:diguanylate cyclase (GGDEF)-like protein
MKILIVEDDQATGKLLSQTLSANRYTVDLATDGVTGLQLAELWEYDLILLDVKLPKLDGIQVCRAIRSRVNKTPILMLTAQESTEDVITGLDAGADDYVIKPCNLHQLLARIRSLLRRSADIPSPVLTWGELCFDPLICQVTYRQRVISLRSKEYTLLELFLRHPQRIFSRSAILDHLWTANNFPSEGAVTNLIKDLRHQLTTAGVPEDLIETVYGLGYRLKALPEPQEQSSSTRRKPDDQALLVSMAQLAEQFQPSVQQRLLVLEVAVHQQLQGQLTADRWQATKEEVHRLAGSLGMYGYGRAAEIARSLDCLLAQVAEADLAQFEQLLQGVSELRQELSHPPTLTNEFLPSVLLPLVLVISENDQWAEALQQEARHWNLRVEIIPDWSPAQQQFILETPAAIALESNGTEIDQEAIRQISQQFPEVPVITLAEPDNLTTRVMASRCGSVRYLGKPVIPAQLFEAVIQLSPQFQNGERAKALIVDDDSAIHPILTRLLQPWGVDIVNLEKPEQFWQVLTQTNPNLLLIDIEMPMFNGIELCRVVRQDLQYGDLPIIVITAHAEADCIQQVFEAGADDLIYKPLINSELVTRVINRIQRSRLRQQLDRMRRQQSQLWQQQAMMDALTQVANRRAFTTFLQQTWQQHQAEQLPLSLILCDVDEFKRYNDRYGHAQGDVCLQQIANAIQQCIKPTTDQVARYGGEEFTVILPDTTPGDAVKVAARIQQAIANLKILHSSDATHPYVSLSLGITGTTPDGEKTIMNLIAMADRALYAAKEQGRNTYCLYPL